MTPSKERALMKTVKGMIATIVTTQETVDSVQETRIEALEKAMKGHLKSHEVAKSKKG